MIESHVSWRWVFWVMLIFAGVCAVGVIVLVPESYAPIILLKKVRVAQLNSYSPLGL